MTGDSLQITGLAFAIPDGTYVRARFGCGTDVWGGGNEWRYAEVDNLHAIDGTPNPTEPGTRLWLVAAGGAGSSPDDLPFSLERKTTCTIPSSSDDPYENDEVWVSRLIVSGDDFRATAEPGEIALFTVSTGDHAGSYQLHNVNVTGYALGPHLGSTGNFTITRTD